MMAVAVACLLVWLRVIWIFLEPILSKARKAIEDVATEGGFTYIFDKSQGSILYAQESENILPLVKKKLKL